ncbi:MAG: TonB-dependent receptor [Candidatus Thiodiazotropha sp. (ex Ctena orbiculata)]|uniref:TonB-dependent receptor n=1 Tax=Candidatus Thiodiazotropha taylori TaxID=2792791 RepID=A0A944M841_9GAMM|nr:TonB-dependent receptor [Candidatus Thiodiazotropha taylori]MBV2137893.1 TonB-dependent receptor [Candidatus Thiodiazotropha taylori]
MSFVRQTLALPLTIATTFLQNPALAEERVGSTPLDDISVTATRVEKTLETVPAAVGIVQQEEVQFAEPQLGLDESLSKVPGIFMQNRYNFAQDLRVSIRGFGARSAFGIRGIKVIVDGIPETLPDGQANVDSIDIGSIGNMQVIRGPVSALYGNASGGALLIESEEPPETPFISLRPTFGEDGLQKHQLKFGGKADRFDYLLNLSNLTYDGYREQSGTELSALNSKFGFDLDGGARFSTVLNYTDSPKADDPGGLTEALVDEDPTQAWSRNLSLDSGEKLEQTRLGFVYDRPLGDSGELRVRNYYVSRDLANRLPIGATGHGILLDRFAVGGGAQYTHTAPLSGHANRLTLGVDLDRQEDERKRFLLAGEELGTKIQDQDEQVDSIGLYIQNEYSFSERVELTLGGRYDRLDFDVEDNFLSNGDDSGDVSFSRFSPSLGLRFTPRPGLNLYANISRSFESPTAVELRDPDGAGFNQELDPQVATNYEIGVKGRLGSKARYDLALFTMDVSDELVPFEIDDIEFYENAGESRRNGLEAQLVFEPVEHLIATLAYTYSDFEFDEFIDDSGNDFSGKTIPGVPENLLSADFTYTHPNGVYGQFTALYVDEIYANNANTVTNDAYTVADLRLGYTRFFGPWELSPFIGVNNMFDKEYNGNVRINAFGGRYFEPAPDRDVYAGLTLRYDFEG